MKILISNDDGVFAPGIQALAKRLSQDHEVTIVAPLEERSTTGHTLSLDNPIRLIQVDGANVFGCSGYPADCILLGFGEVMSERPDFVLSGINRGANLGQDVYYSGTMAAAREATFHGVPSMAVSLDCDFMGVGNENHYFSVAADIVAELLEKGIREKIPPLHVLNLNIPDGPRHRLKGLRLTELGLRRYSEKVEKRKDFRGKNYFWVGGLYEGHEGHENSDCYAVENGYVSLSLLGLLNQAPMDQAAITALLDGLDILN